MEADDQQEDLLENEFFKLVKLKFPSTFELVENNGYLLCVPQQASLSDLSSVDQTFVGKSKQYLVIRISFNLLCASRLIAYMMLHSSYNYLIHNPHHSY
jgi:hypothetical protein